MKIHTSSLIRDALLLWSTNRLYWWLYDARNAAFRRLGAVAAKTRRDP